MFQHSGIFDQYFIGANMFLKRSYGCYCCRRRRLLPSYTCCSNFKFRQAISSSNFLFLFSFAWTHHGSNIGCTSWPQKRKWKFSHTYKKKKRGWGVDRFFFFSSSSTMTTITNGLTWMFLNWKQQQQQWFEEQPSHHPTYRHTRTFKYMCVCIFIKCVKPSGGRTRKLPSKIWDICKDST